MSRNRSRSMSSSSSGRGAQSSSWNGDSGHRLHVSDLGAGVRRKDVERAFEKYGPINEVWVANNPPCFAFINFKHRSDAEQALREIDGKTLGSARVGVSWARTRTYGSRNRGGRNDSFSSYPSVGPSRRRSRSGSRSGSRNQKRRHSRSRSRDRHRHRDHSSRDRKRSNRTSKEKNGTDESKKDREPSATNARSRSRSASRRKSPNDDKNRKRSPSRGSGNNEKVVDPPGIANRSPLVAHDE